MRRHIKRTALSVAVAQAALIWGGAAYAQTAAQAPGGAGGAEQGADTTQTIVVTGQRAAMQSATKIKQYSEEIVEAVVAEEAGKLPDKSITEVLQRVSGVMIDRNRSRGDPEHFSVEGSGVSIRGLSWGSSTLNGREAFSAGGRELSWGDVPPELMSAVIIHKNPPAELIEGGVSGQVDLRTALPFDYKSGKFALTANGNYNVLGSKKSPGVSGLYSKRWDTSIGQVGALLDLSYNRSTTRNDTIQLDAYFPRTDIVDGQTVWVPKSASWRSNSGETERAGVYGALQWKKDNVESSLTYFHSGYKDSNEEYALYTGVENAYRSKLVNPVFNANGVLQSATYTYPFGGLGANNFAAGGLNFNTNTGFNERRSQTREIAWNTKWTINDRWSLQNDLQWVHSTNRSMGSNMALVTYVPSMDIDLTRAPVNIGFNQAARDFLANPGNYYLDHVMPGMDKANGDLYAWKADVKYKFDDPVLRDLRFGLRLTDRSANRVKAGGSEWFSFAEPWSVKQTSVPGRLPNSTDGQNWQSRATFGYLKDPRYAALTSTTMADFANFFNGKVGQVPALVMPSMEFTRDYPAAYQQASQALKLLCQDGNTAFGSNNDCSTAGSAWTPLTYDGDPSRTSRQQEKTQAAYVSTRFGFDELRFPVEGNLGVRVVRTQTTAHGHTVFKPNYGSAPRPEIPLFGEIDDPLNVEHTYVNVLPSLNLKTDLTDKVQARFAFAQSMYRPGFNQLNEYIVLSQNIKDAPSGGGVQNISYSGRDDGNANLKPVRANSYDLTLEWYPGSGSSLTLGLFHKQVRDIVLQSAFTRSYNSLDGNPQSFLITAPTNAASGSVSGAEIAGQTYLDHVPALKGLLPDWAKGFGVSANYTYIKSKQTLDHPFDLKYCPAVGSFNNSSLNLYGCDTNGLPFTSLPIMYLSKNAYNLTFLYDRGPLSARLAYSWRGRFLQGVQVNGTRGDDGTSADPARKGMQDVSWGLPTWQEAMGQLDFGIDYKFNDNLSANLSATNLTDTVIKQTQQQHIGTMGRAWFEPGRSYRVSLRYAF
ncbi:TonB-dependent receptor [Pseudoduganella namucuonensis]|uniref:TonB-dependent receptor n=1 Tax=Pseudoduganella namucuonensis TaxID=1035707 RepID=A0A1I7LUE5_9BURK|nr:TonB-dependent receptor [Pseudoduganella namucuonensis]SFV13321.1 TonB-dependent receptor [Pseudoduganella namucuonensis]